MKFLTPFLLFAQLAMAQIPQTLIVEHFTNTRCGTCAGRNPGFYSNYENFPEAIHIAFHPSSPYPQCILNQYNTSGNDFRTNYYGIYGATPRLIMNGEIISAGANYGDASLFSSRIGGTTNVSISLLQTAAIPDSVAVKITVKNESNFPFTDHKLFLFLVEDTIYYAAPNGEDEHYDVYRINLLEKEGYDIGAFIPASDSIVILTGYKLDPTWVYSRMSLVGVVQNVTSKEILQAAKVSTISDPDTLIEEPDTTVGILDTEVDNIPFLLFPNPVQEELSITSSLFETLRLTIYNIQGELIYDDRFTSSAVINTSSLSNGMYLIRLLNQAGETSTRTFIKL